MSDNNLLLLIAYHYHPDTAIGAARPYRFAKYLRRSGMRVHVITASKPAGNANDDPDLSWVPDPFPDVKTGIGGNLERGIRKFLLPGVVGTQWAFRACAAAAQFIRSNPQYRYVSLSSHPPAGVHLAAAWLKRTEKVPWIADFRDPLGHNPSIDQFHPLQISLFRWLEARSIHQADAVIANTDSVADLWRKLHPSQSNKISVLWNGFDAEERVHAAPVAGGPRKRISHIGQLYWGRTARPLLESVGRLVDRGWLDPSGFQIELVGSMQSDCLPPESFTRHAKEQGWLRLVTQPVPKATALELTTTADGLLLIQPQSAVQVPGKLFEYIQIGRPVLAYILPDSPIERILSKSGVPYSCVYAGQDESSTDASTAAYFDLSFGQHPPSEWFEKEFNAANQNETLLQVIRSISRSS